MTFFLWYREQPRESRGKLGPDLWCNNWVFLFQKFWFDRRKLLEEYMTLRYQSTRQAALSDRCRIRCRLQTLIHFQLSQISLCRGYGLYDNFEDTVSVKNLPDKIDENFSDEILSDQVSVMCSNWDTLDNIRNKTWILRLED